MKLLILLRFWKSALFSTFILVLSLLPFQSSTGSAIFSIPHADKIIHFGLYGFLAFLMLFDSEKVIRKGRFIWVVGLCLFFGGVIEILQITVENRSGEWFDLLANFLGSLMAIPSYLLFKRFIL